MSRSRGLGGIHRCVVTSSHDGHVLSLTVARLLCLAGPGQWLGNWHLVNLRASWVLGPAGACTLGLSESTEVELLHG